MPVKEEEKEEEQERRRKGEKKKVRKNERKKEGKKERKERLDALAFNGSRSYELLGDAPKRIFCFPPRRSGRRKF